MCMRDMEQCFEYGIARRLVPFVMIHEFEALLFSDCRRFAEGVYEPSIFGDLQRIRDSFRTPEEIDDSPTGAPSKRIQAVIPKYQKLAFGTRAASEIGISAMQTACPHFANWLDRLSELAAS